MSSVFRYCLTAIDSYARLPEAFPPSDINAEAVAKAFVSVWVARLGCPQQFTTDHGRQFETRLFKTLANSSGSSLTQTTAWHPASNFLIERLHRKLEDRPDESCRLTLGRGSTISPVGYSQCLKRGLKSHISQTSVWFTTAVTGGVLRPFPQRINRRHQIRLPAKGTNWRSSTRTGVPA